MAVKQDKSPFCAANIECQRGICFNGNGQIARAWRSLMVLSAQASWNVAKGIRNRGRQYFLRGAVQILHGDADAVEASVQGSDEYYVTLERDKKSLTVYCTCPYYQKYLDACKHIWATMLAAEHKGLLAGTGYTGKVGLDYLDGQADQLLERDEDDYDSDQWQEDDEQDAARAVLRLPSPRRRRDRDRPGPSSWKQHLDTLRLSLLQTAPSLDGWPRGHEILYLIDLPATMKDHGLVVDIVQRQPKHDGTWGKVKAVKMQLQHIDSLPDPNDRQIVSLLNEPKEQDHYWAGSGYRVLPSRYVLAQALAEVLVPRLCQTGRCCWRRTPDDEAMQPLQWDDGEAWELCLQVRPNETGKQLVVGGVLRRGAEQMPLATPELLTAGGFVFVGGRVARLQDGGAFAWIALFREQKSFSVPVKDKDALLEQLLGLPRLPRLDLPEDLRFEEVAPVPRPRLRVRKPPAQSWGRNWLVGELSFDYDGTTVLAHRPGEVVYQFDTRRLIRRAVEAEHAAREKLVQVGFRPSYYEQADLELAPRNLPRVVRTLLQEGWLVEAEGKLYRRPGAIQIEVNSGIDWFELHGSVQFGDTTARLPELLAALKRGEDLVRLDDGSYGMLPEDWLKKYGVLAGLGTAHDGHLRFSKCQVGLLDALLTAQSEVNCDEVFAKAREELHNFEGIAPADPPGGFSGKLRGYQRDGLGWLYFLQQFGFGGCLADDMGLGKTVQVLALLEARRAARTQKHARKNGTLVKPGPSLVVVPRSLVFNWVQEAARFTPKLRVLDHTGIGRLPPGAHFNDYDVILTTYGTLRRDALHFKDVKFDYCILDEGQAIKNAKTDSAKAVRLLQGDHRLVLSGTPIENHLGELWSLFDFLNPGMLGRASVLQLGGAGARNPSPETRTLLAKALRPFILRRTKDQVAKDLPQKLEQTLFCELEPAQRKCYDELRDHFRRELLGKIEHGGINKFKIQILEALLRLRQAACHPGLIDKERIGEPSAKLDMLLPQLAEVLEEGHKALVFSQFTSMLAIVRDRLDQEKITYEYLDGRTRRRGDKVERFQNDPNCKLFLVSLKAGGLGLNLTAAEYVFLLDPWWNPAVEAQAIDRAHRIGQTRPVFAYRLIARDTVEEKVLELQQSKRALADAIISADNSLIRNLGKEDLELLLS
jgi:superfamily II DNA or RNA helicase